MALTKVQQNLSSTPGIVDNSNATAITIDSSENIVVAGTLSNSSYLYADQNWVTTQINNLIDSAPGALNTLNELAAAMGDDANFSTTTTNSIATKAPLANPTFTGSISHASDLTLNVGGDISLDADGGDIFLKDDGATYGQISSSTNGLILRSVAADKDIFIQGFDSSSLITALTFDMSEAGTAYFNHDIRLVDNGQIVFGSDGDASLYHTGSEMTLNQTVGNLTFDVAGEIRLDADDGIIRIRDDGGDYGMFQISNSDFIIRSMVADKDLIFRGNDSDGGGVITALTLDMSNAGKATFSGDVQAAGLYVGSTNTSYDLYNNGTTYLNGATIVDDTLTANAITMSSGGVLTQTVGSSGGVYHSIGHSGNENWSWAAQSGSGSTDYVDFGIASGTRVMTWQEDGKVGIGTSSPLTNLHIGSGTEGENLGLKINRGATTNFLVACDGTKQAYIGVDNSQGYIKLGSLSNHPVQISQNNANAIYIDTSKRVGIGNGDAAQSPVAGLQLSRGSPARMMIHMDADTAGGEAQLQFKADSTNTDVRIKGAIIFRRDDPGTRGTGNLHFCVEGNNSDVSASTSHSRMMIDSNGAIGINNTSPVARLDIIGSGYEDIRLGSNRTDNTNKTAGLTSYTYTNQTVSVFQMFNQNGSNAIYYGSADGAHRGIQQHYFYTNSDYNSTSGHKLRYTIHGNGKHEWRGNHQGDAVGHFIFSNQGDLDSTSTNCTLMVKNGGQSVQIMPWSGLGARLGTRTGGWNSNSGGNCYLTGQDATCLVLKSNGTAYLANGSTAVTSDQRLKKNITDMADGQLAKINSLKVRNFEWKDDRKPGTQTGLIAQEVESVISDAIEETEFAPDPDDTSRDFDGDVKIVKYGDVQMRLLKAVQELSAKLEAAEARITTLEG